ncbi:hypothetical protein Tco_1250871 [Tanacetum coccineum]
MDFTLMTSFNLEEQVEIMDREVKWLNRSRIPLVKVRWNSKRGPEFTWEREDQFRKKYPYLFTKTAPSIPYNTSLHIIQHESKKKREEETKVLERETRERVEREYRKGNEKDILK